MIADSLLSSERPTTWCSVRSLLKVISVYASHSDRTPGQSALVISSSALPHNTSSGVQVETEESSKHPPLALPSKPAEAERRCIDKPDPYC